MIFYWSVNFNVHSRKAKIDGVTGNYLPNGAASKAGLNKSILDTSPCQFIQMVRVKAEEAGYKLKELETRKLKPSQRCAQCSDIVEKNYQTDFIIVLVVLRSQETLTAHLLCSGIHLVL